MLDIRLGPLDQAPVRQVFNPGPVGIEGRNIGEEQSTVWLQEAGPGGPEEQSDLSFVQIVEQSARDHEIERTMGRQFLLYRKDIPDHRRNLVPNPVQLVQGKFHGVLIGIIQNELGRTVFYHGLDGLEIGAAPCCNDQDFCWMLRCCRLADGKNLAGLTNDFVAVLLCNRTVERQIFKPVFLGSRRRLVDLPDQIFDGLEIPRVSSGPGLEP